MRKKSTVTPEEAREKKLVYAKQYYKDNKDNILAAKKKRYETDDEYKAAIKYRTKLRSAGTLTDMSCRGGSRGGRSFREIIMVNGKDQMKEFISIGYLAREVGRDVITVRKWISEGIIPAPGFYRGNTRYYMVDQVDTIVKAYNKADWKKHLILDTGFKELAFKYFSEICID